MAVGIPENDDRSIFERTTEAPDPAPSAHVLEAGGTGASTHVEHEPDTSASPVAGRHAHASEDEPVRWLGRGPRYEPRGLIGVGGMGEVILCGDQAVGREVAMKRIRDRARGVKAEVQRRFVHEARVQGRLEHPAIVPVYDVGVDADGKPYFTMKHVRGESLREVLRALRDHDPAARARYSRRRLLTLYSQICMAIHFAHQKGVVHRDLKPANLMFGSFGEAYVLDWGLAIAPADSGPRREDAAGHGTPGYMAPEQITPAEVTGDEPSLDARADVYALGIILFEILTLQRAHGDATLPEILAATLATDGVRPSARAADADVPPELDELCFRATRRDRSLRLAGADELSRAVEAFLDGDRDLVLRREAAAAHAGLAAGALERARRAPTPEIEHAERARAMRDVAAALGLDATHRSARQTLVQLIAEPLASPPPAATRQMAANALAAYHLAGRAALAFYGGYLLYLPLLLWMGVRDTALFALGWASIASCAAATYVLLRRPPARLDRPLVHLALSTFTVATVSVMFGPFVLVPMLGVAMCVCYTASVGHANGLVPAASSVAVIAPAALGWLGIIPTSSTFADGRWVIEPSVFAIEPVATQAFLLVASVGTIVPACVFVARLRRAYLDAERRLQLQAWQLSQIVPDGS